MIHPRTVGGRTLAALSVALLAWIAAGRSGGEAPLSDPSGRQKARTIEAVPTVMITVSDRPAFSGGWRRTEGPRSLAATDARVVRLQASVSAGRDLLRSRFIQTAGPLALGFSRHGPPASLEI